MWAYNLLRTQYFHGVSSGNQPPYLLTSRYGKVRSKKHPNPQLSDEQKAANTALSQVRILIEHAIGGMKRYNILVHVFRNRKVDFEDDAVGICAGLWNFALSY